MTELLQANIFFIITSIAVIIFTSLVCIFVYHLIKIVRSIRRMVERVEAGSEVFAEDIDNLRASLNPARLIQFVMSFVPGTQKTRKTKRSTKKQI